MFISVVFTESGIRKKSKYQLRDGKEGVPYTDNEM